MTTSASLLMRPKVWSFLSTSLLSVSLSALLLAPAASLQAANPTSGTLSLSSGPVQWDGFSAAPATSQDNEASCQEGTNCDTFTLKLAPGDYAGKRLRFTVTWSNPLNDYDVYLHAGSNAGPVVKSSTDGAPETLEENTYDINTQVVAGVNDIYTIRTVYWAVITSDPYHATASLEDIPVTQGPQFRTASYLKDSKSGIKFSRNRSLYAPAANGDGEPSARVDFMGNAYVGAIRGLTRGNDLWRFDLNPGSPTYDPFLRSATPVFDANGNVQNPAWKGQPDAIAPNGDEDLGADGGGDMDIAVGFKSPTGSLPGTPPIVAMTSLVAANVSSQRSYDRGETYMNNPAGNTTVPVDDREWNEFLGGDVVYLGYRELVGLVATAKFYINRSDDGGLTYGPAVLAGLGGNLVGNIDVDQHDGSVYFCYQGTSNNQVKISVGETPSLVIAPVVYNSFIAVNAQANIGHIFPVCKVADDGTVYIAYSDGGTAIYLTHSTDKARTWSAPVRVSDLRGSSASVMPWIETGKQPGTVAIVWYGAEAADSEDGLGQNNNAANWKVFFSQTLNATASSPTFRQTVASDHFIHGSNISTSGLVVGGESPNRNLLDFFQVAIDPSGLALIAYTDDSNDFAGHTYVTHQTAGFNLHTGQKVKINGNDPADKVDASRPEVTDFRHDARLEGRPAIIPDVDTPADILSIDYGCGSQDGATMIEATMRTSGLDIIPPHSFWRVNFATHPTKPGLSDRADQWFLQAETDDLGNRSFWYGTATRNTDGSITYTKVGPADFGQFDLVNRSVTLRVDRAKLNAIATRGAITSTTKFVGLRGSAGVANVVVVVQGVAVAAGNTDSTRGGTSFVCGK